MLPCRGELLYDERRKEWTCGGEQLQEAPERVVHVVVAKDILGTGTDPASGERYLMTDGCGLISLDLAKQIPPVSGGLRRRDTEGTGFEAAAATQMRWCVRAAQTCDLLFALPAELTHPQVRARERGQGSLADNGAAAERHHGAA